MKLDNIYEIRRFNDVNIVLVKHGTNKKTNKPKEKIIGFFPNVKSALKRYCNIQTVRSVDTAETLIAKIEELERLIENDL